MFKQLTAPAIALVLSACTASPYRPVDPAKVIAQPPAVSEAQPAKVKILRRRGSFGVGLTGTFVLDGQEIVKLDRSDYFEFDAKPGPHEFGVRSWTGAFVVPVPMYYKYDMDVEAGKNYMFMLFPTYGGGVAIAPIDDLSQW